eukprot:scaffold215617_cov17-Tisochrysis_lutea.AAC.1
MALKLATKFHYHAVKTFTKDTNTKYATQLSNPSNGGLGVEAIGRAACRRSRRKLGKMDVNPADPH